MRTETNQIKVLIVKLAVNQDKIGLDMAVAMIVPIAGKGMIAMTRRQGPVSYKQIDNFHQASIERLSVPSGFFPFIVVFETTCRSNCSHSNA